MRVLTLDEAFGEAGPDPLCAHVARPSVPGLVALFLLFGLGSLLVGTLVTVGLSQAPLWGRLLGGLVALPFALVLALVDATLLGLVASALKRRTSWWAALADEGLWLHLRSFGNAHFGTSDPTVVFLSWDELGAAGRVDEWTRSIDSDGVEYKRRTKRLELVVRADTGELAAALAAERARPAPERRFLGIATRSRHKHWPVQLPAPDRLRIDWPGRRFVAALAARLERLDPRAEGYGADGASRDPETVLRELLDRGEDLEAIRLLRERTGCGLSEARATVRRLAGEPPTSLRRRAS